MKKIVVKFGGTSLADAGQIKKAAEIILADPDRRFAVVSAPGKRFKEDTKVTDLLLNAWKCADAGEDFAPLLAEVAGRLREIAAELGLEIDFSEDLRRIGEQLSSRPEREYTASRGEYFSGRLMAAYLGWPFLDAADCIVFDENGQLMEEETDRRLAAGTAGLERAVIPGFYGRDTAGRIRTFSRGGSDITGSLVARAVGASLYENWTDVSGLLFTDPHMVKDPAVIRYITYEELRELSYLGASVLHEDAVFPVRKAGIPINIRNTNRPQDDGTLIVAELPEGYDPGAVTGVAGKKGYTTVHVTKSLMNNEIGFAARLLMIFAEHGVSLEHCPTGIDTIAVVVQEALFAPKKDAIMEAIRQELQPEELYLDEDLAVIAVVGTGIMNNRGVAARVFTAVAGEGVNVRMIDSGAGGKDIILSVRSGDLEAAVQGIYKEFA